MSASGHKRTSRHVRFMSALPPKADIEGSASDVRFVPKADKVQCSKKTQFDHLVGKREQLGWNDKRMRTGGFGVGIAYHSARRLTNPRPPEMAAVVLGSTIVQKKRFHHSFALDLYGSSSFKVKTIAKSKPGCAGYLNSAR
jgi:hypothetical protein